MPLVQLVESLDGLELKHQCIHFWTKLWTELLYLWSILSLWNFHTEIGRTSISNSSAYLHCPQCTHVPAPTHPYTPTHTSTNNTLCYILVHLHWSRFIVLLNHFYRTTPISGSCPLLKASGWGVRTSVHIPDNHSVACALSVSRSTWTAELFSRLHNDQSLQATLTIAVMIMSMTKCTWNRSFSCWGSILTK